MVFLGMVSLINGHGRLMDPPGRGSVWRVKDSNQLIEPYDELVEPNYTDNGNNCGGTTYQAGLNGKCGLCGDPFGNPEPRAHEDGGKYGKGIIVGLYQSGGTMTTRVQITSHHKGWMEFWLCARDNELWSANVIEDRMVRLKLEDGGYKWNLPDPHESEYDKGGYWYTVKVQLPDVECTRCILRWKYHAGNSWGCDAPYDCGIGKGDQEEFYN